MVILEGEVHNLEGKRGYEFESNYSFLQIVP